MSRRTRQLAQLARIARLKADRELRQFAACRSQADAMRHHVEGARDELTQAMAAPATDALDQWRLATALVGYRAGRLHEAEEGLRRMQPAVEATRAAAAAAFGRAEAIAALQRLTTEQERSERLRKGP